MKLTLQITASASTLATILANLPDDATVEAPNAPSTSTGIGTPVAPVSPPSVPNTVAVSHVAPSQPMMPQPITSQDDDDDTGPAAEGTPETDKNGLPWDERIHSAGKNRLNADGTWRKRRGVDDATVAAVEAELRGVAGTPTIPAMQIPDQPVALPPTIPAMPQPVPVPQPIPAPLQEAVNTAMGVPAPVPAPAPVPQPAPAPAPAAPPAAGNMDFMAMMQHLGPKFQERDAAGAPLIHADYLAQLTGEISTAFQLPQPLNAFTDIQSDQRMVDYAIQLFQRDGRW